MLNENQMSGPFYLALYSITSLHWHLTFMWSHFLKAIKLETNMDIIC